MSCSKTGYKHFVLFVFISAGIFFLGACQSGSGGSAGEIVGGQGDNKPLPFEAATGSINGQPWIFHSGKAEIYQNSGDAYLAISLWNSAVEDPCAETRGSDYQIRLYVANQTGAQTVGADPFAQVPAIIFSDLTQAVHPDNNIVADQGHVQLTLIGDQVQGVLDGSFPTGFVKKTQVSGGFVVPFCRN